MAKQVKAREYSVKITDKGSNGRYIKLSFVLTEDKKLGHFIQIADGIIPIEHNGERISGDDYSPLMRIKEVVSCKEIPWYEPEEHELARMSEPSCDAFFNPRTGQMLFSAR